MNARHLSTQPAETPVAGLLSTRRVVAAVYSDATLAAALALESAPAAPDWLELRIDGFHDHPEALNGLVACGPRPFVLTVRHPAEGGAAGAPSDAAGRAKLYARFLAAGAGKVAAVDVEVRSLRALATTVRTVQEKGGLVVASFHDFVGVPALATLRERARRALDGEADIFKVAATVRRPGELARLLDLLDWGQNRGQALAVMGMGPLGRVSRLALAAAGSVLNYAYLGGAGPQVPGQWPAATLRARIEEVTGDR